MIVSSINLYNDLHNNDRISFCAKTPKGFRKGVEQLIQKSEDVIGSDKFQKTVKKVVAPVAEILPKKLGSVPQKSFNDIGGYDDIVNVLMEDVIFPMKYPKAFPNIMRERGIILYGSSGCGKTTLAEAIAKESGAYFIKVDGVELTPDWLQNYEKHIGQIFDEASEHQPAIIFLDNIDKFSDKYVRSYNNKPQVVVMKENNKSAEEELPVEEGENYVMNLIHHKMNELESKGHDVVVIGASKNEDILSSPLVSSQRMMVLDIPDAEVKDLTEIFNIHAKDMQLDPSVEVENIMAFMCSYGANASDVVSLIKEVNKQAYARCGIFDKMLNGTFKQSDLKKVKVNMKDFENGLNIDFCPKIQVAEPEPKENHIGFRFKSDYESQEPPASVDN